MHSTLILILQLLYKYNVEDETSELRLRMSFCDP